jgi:hypothetical protein
LLYNNKLVKSKNKKGVGMSQTGISIKRSFSLLAGTFAIFSTPIANAAVLDFNFLDGLGYNHREIIEDGFKLENPLLNFVSTSPDRWGYSGSFNGTKTVYVDFGPTNEKVITFTLTALDNSSFDLVSLDLGAMFLLPSSAYAGNARNFSLIGHKAIIQTLSYDFGINLEESFQTIVLSEEWTKLTSVSLFTFGTLSGYGTYTNFDNIVVMPSVSDSTETNPTSTVPEPGSVALVGLGAVGILASYRSKRKTFTPS